MLWSLEQRRWLPEEPYELSDRFPAAPVSTATQHQCPSCALCPGYNYDNSCIPVIYCIFNNNLKYDIFSRYQCSSSAWSFVRRHSTQKPEEYSTLKLRNSPVKEYNLILFIKGRPFFLDTLKYNMFTPCSNEVLNK